MSKRLKLISIALLALLIIAYAAFTAFAPAMIEKSLNKNLAYTPLHISADIKALHDKLTIMDWHADTLLWNRDFLEQADFGQVDLPRLKKGGMNIQMLTTVTKSPSGQNYDQNTSDSSDNITLLAVAQGWPVNTWGSLLERALFQAKKLDDTVTR